MLRFSCVPDKVFNNILIEALEIPIDDLSDDIRENETDCTHMYFYEDMVKAYGEGVQATIIIKNELEKLLKAHKSDKLYMPTDHHFKLLYYLLDFYCDVYNDSVEYNNRDEENIHKDKKGRPIKNIAMGMIETVFFWDTDFLIEKETAKKLLQNPELKDNISKHMDLSKDAISASLNLKIDTSDLLLKVHEEMDIEEEDINWIYDEDDLDSGSDN